MGIFQKAGRCRSPGPCGGRAAAGRRNAGMVYPGRRCAVHGAALYGFFGRHGCGARPVAHAGDCPAGEFPPAVLCTERGGLLAALAHHAGRVVPHVSAVSADHLPRGHRAEQGERAAAGQAGGTRRSQRAGNARRFLADRRMAHGQLERGGLRRVFRAGHGGIAAAGACVEGHAERPEPAQARLDDGGSAGAHLAADPAGAVFCLYRIACAGAVAAAGQPSELAVHRLQRADKRRNGAAGMGDCGRELPDSADR